MERQLDFTVDNVTYNGLPDYVRKLKDVNQMKFLNFFSYFKTVII